MATWKVMTKKNLCVNILLDYRMSIIFFLVCNISKEHPSECVYHYRIHFTLQLPSDTKPNIQLQTHSIYDVAMFSLWQSAKLTS